MSVAPSTAPTRLAVASPAFVRNVAGFLSGVLFAVGLVVSGMTRPENVIGFLDVAGDWNPSLAFVMGGAIPVYALAFRFARRRPSPALAPAFDLPTQTRLDGDLVSGAAIFGVGWGLVGLCPGPAVVGAGSGLVTALVFVGAMLVGMAIEHRVPRRGAV